MNEPVQNAAKVDQTSFCATPLKILTVGDGDLTLSLALSRAYSSQLDLIATTLEPSFEDLCKKYVNSDGVVKELQYRGATVEYGVDATNLTTYPSLVSKQGFDLILFHHPHLGLGTLEDEQYHAHRHFVLISHFLASAKELLCLNTAKNDAIFYDGRISLCLAHDQPQTWKMEEAAHCQGLNLVKEADTVVPFHRIVSELSLSQSWISQMENEHTPSRSKIQPLESAPLEPHFRAPRRYRNGKLGSYHFLGKYGYQHRRTHGDIHSGREGDMNVHGSRHFFFAIDKEGIRKREARRDDHRDRPYHCSICGSNYLSESALLEHIKAPALPDPPSEKLYNSTTQPRKQGDKNMTNGTPANVSISSENLSFAPSSLSESERASIRTKFESNWVIAPEDHGKRLRRFLQHVAMPMLSRKQNDVLVSEGQIYVNGYVALDTSRILYNGDVVSTATTVAQATKIVKNIQSERSEIPIVASYPIDDDGNADDNLTNVLPREYLLVANKPVGMRNKGNSGCTGTLEEAVSLQTKKPYKSISAIDTGCNGLSVLELQEEAPLTSKIALKQEFTALVHGLVPLEWDTGVTAKVPWEGVRQWRRKAETISVKTDADIGDGGIDDSKKEVHDSEDEDEGEESNEGSDDRDKEAVNGDFNKCSTMTIQCIERTLPVRQIGASCATAPKLCTLKISTSCLVSGLCQAICLYLRKQRHPVVGDRKNHREYVALPRSIRNRIKNKLCLGCYKINIDASFSYQRRHQNVDSDSKNQHCRKESTPEESDQLKRILIERHWMSALEIPVKLRALHWQDHCDNATLCPK